MPESLYIDNATRKRIVTFWIPVCLVFLHIWGCVFVGVIAWPTMPAINIETGYKAFKTCNWGIWGLILLLISDKAVELVISRVGQAAGVAAGQVVETTTTQKTVVTPASPPDVKNMEVKAENVNVS